MSARLARSYLFAPGDNARLLQKVFTAGADAVVLDLEDAVAPDRKATARAMVAEVLRQRAAGGPHVYVRINAVETGLWRDDLDAVVGAGLDGVRIAKVDGIDDVRQVARHLDGLEAARATSGPLPLVPTIESASGVYRAAEIVDHPRVQAVAFGATDFLRDVGAGRQAGDTETLYARSHLVLVSRVAGRRPPVASVYTQVTDLDGLRRSTEAARELGFFGRSCIHPLQVPVVNAVFTPTPEAIDASRRIVEQFEHARVDGIGSVRMPSGEFVDRAVVERARAVLALAADLAGTADEGNL